jgi:hypothetical protein
VLVVGEDRETFLFETALSVLAGGHRTGGQTRTVQEERLTQGHIQWADAVVLSSLPGGSSRRLDWLAEHVRQGGRLIVFATRGIRREVADRLSRDGSVAAVPERWVEEVCSPAAQPVSGADGLIDEAIARSLLNYRLDRVALKGFWQCRTPGGADCIWHLSNGAGLIYAVSQDGGTSLFVNTSIDDSRGLLAKSGAWVAFCRMLLGQTDRQRPLTC